MARPKQPPRLEKIGDIYYILDSKRVPDPKNPGKLMTRTTRDTTGESDWTKANEFLTGVLKGTAEKVALAGVLTIRQGMEYYKIQHLETENKISKDEVIKRLTTICTALGLDKPMDAVTAEDLTAFIRDRRLDPGKRAGKGVVDRTVYADLAAFRTCRNFCRIKGALQPRQELVKIVIKDCKSIPKNSPGGRMYFYDDEADLLLARARLYDKRHYPHRLTPLYRWLVIALETGRRTEAVETIDWPRVDMIGRVMDFRRPDMEETKKRRGMIEMSDFLYETLKEAFDQKLKGNDFVLDRPSDRYAAFKTLCRENGLGWAHPHITRHTFGTRLAQKGVDPMEVADIMEVTPAVALKYYFHNDPLRRGSVIRQHGRKTGPKTNLAVVGQLIGVGKAAR